MNIAILSYCGMVGKTTLAANLFVPRMPDSKFIAVETINETAAKLGLDVEVITGDNFLGLYKRLGTMRNGIIDIGASNVEPFLRGLLRFEDAQEDIDYFIVPTTPDSKVQIETVKTLNTLAELGIPSNKVRVVFNRVVRDVKDEFGPILGYAKSTKNAIANPECAIYETELYNMLTTKKLTIAAALSDQNDYRALLRSEDLSSDPKKFALYSDMRAIKSLSKKANENLDTVFENLFKD